MPNRYHTKFSQSKISAKGPRPSNGPGSVMSGKDKPAFASAHVPGKTQSKDRSMGVKKCKIYPKSEGL